MNAAIQTSQIEILDHTTKVSGYWTFVQSVSRETYFFDFSIVFERNGKEHTWQGDFADVVAWACNNLPGISDYSTDCKDGLILFEETVEMYFSPAADDWKELRSGRKYATFQDWVSEGVTDEILIAFLTSQLLLSK